MMTCIPVEQYVAYTMQSIPFLYYNSTTSPPSRKYTFYNCNGMLLFQSVMYKIIPQTLHNAGEYTMISANTWAPNLFLWAVDYVV